MQTDRFGRIDSLWVTLRHLAREGRDVQPVIEGLQMEYDCAQRDAQAFGFGDGFTRGQEAGREEGFELGLQEGRADAAHQLCLGVAAAAAVVVRGGTDARTADLTGSDRRQLEKLERLLSDAKAPVH